MRVTESFPRSTLETDTIKKIINAVAGEGVQAISFTGGEPLLDIGRLTELIRYAGSAGIPYIRTGTNGFMFAHSEKEGFTDRIKRMVEKLADTPLRNFWISIDSGVDTYHEKMRGFPGVVAGIEKVLPIFHDAGLYPAANLSINRNVGGDATRNFRREATASEQAYLDAFYLLYFEAFERFYQRAFDLGFTIANTCYPMSIDTPETEDGLSAVYGATTVEDVVRFTASEKKVLLSALIPAIRKFRSKLRIFSPICSLEALVRQYSESKAGPEPYGCRGGIDFFFINAADECTYPCGYRGNENLGEIRDMDFGGIKPGKYNDCRKCDWECFRDPSEMFGPLLDLFSHPIRLLRRLIANPRALGTWFEDLQYYQACDLFDGRRPPDTKKLARFSSTSFHPGMQSGAFPANSH